MQGNVTLKFIDYNVAMTFILIIIIIIIKGYEKNHDFRPISRFISELMQDRAIVTMGGE